MLMSYVAATGFNGPCTIGSWFTDAPDGTGTLATLVAPTTIHSSSR